jgi:transcriptional regulator with XRE-family HTH domain
VYEDIKKRLRGEAEKAGSIAALARRFKVSRAYLSGILNDQWPPSDKVLKALGLERRVTIITSK